MPSAGGCVWTHHESDDIVNRWRYELACPAAASRVFGLRLNANGPEGQPRTVTPLTQHPPSE